MSKKRIAVIGDDSVIAFRSVGLEVYTPSSPQQTIDQIRTLAKQDCLILITEDKAEQASELILQLKAKPYPIILPIPSINGSSSFGISGLKYNIEKAIGMDIVFNKEENE